MSVDDHLEAVLEEIRQLFNVDAYAILENDIWFVCVTDAKVYMGSMFRVFCEEYRKLNKTDYKVVFCAKAITDLSALERLSAEGRLVI